MRSLQWLFIVCVFVIDRQARIQCVPYKMCMIGMPHHHVGNAYYAFRVIPMIVRRLYDCDESIGEMPDCRQQPTFLE